MEFQEILTLIEKVSNSSLTSFSLVENQDGIQISMKKEKKVIKMQKVRETEGEAVQIWAENREVSTQESFLKTGEKIENNPEVEQEKTAEQNVQECPEKEFRSPMEGRFSYSEDGKFLLRVGKELKKGVEIGSITDDTEMPYNLSVRCLGEVTRICVEDGQRIKKGDCLFIAKVEEGDTEFDVL